MKITFVCETLEPGRTGVGDYSWRLAAAVAAQGHETRVVSFADCYVEAPVSGERCIGGQEVLFCRIPKTDAVSVRDRLREWPSDWTSLQFVPYSFHAKGFPSNASFPFSSQVADNHHLMIHETWIGQYPGASWRNRVIGFLQKLFCARMIRAWKPSLIHTSCAVYQSILSSAGLASGILPMFGTIEPTWAAAKENVRRRLAESHPRICESDAIHLRWVILFGSLYAPEQIALALESLAMRAQQAGIQLAVFLAGRGGNREALEQVTEKHSRTILMIPMSHLTDQEVSELMGGMDFGITATPLDGVAKSSAAACMRDHGLPVVACSRGAHSAASEAPFFHVDDFVTQGLVEKPPAFERRDRVHDVAAQFLKDLGKAA